LYVWSVVMKEVIIIGSGVAGLASAVRMAVRGFKVTVFEANSYAGGKLTEINVGPYRFDAGPSLYTMPQYQEELFELAGKKYQDYAPYVRLDPITHYFFTDGTFLVAPADPDEFAREVEQKLGVRKGQIAQHLDRSRKIYELTSNIFLNQSLHKFQHYKPWDLLKAGANLGTLDLFRSMHDANEQQLKEKRAVQLFDRFATYNGSNPYEAPATLNIIPHLEHHIGAYFPLKGMHAISQSMYKLAQELGVEFRFNEKVEEILLEGKKATGVRTTQGSYRSDIVISNMDIVPTYRKLLPKVAAPEKTLRQPRSSSALIFYWGVKKSFPKLHIHNIFFSNDYKKEFSVLFDQKTLPEDMTVYVHISSKLLKEDAPEGCENWFVMVNAPNNQAQDWDQLIPKARKNILQKLESMLGESIEPYIEAEDLLEPRTIESKTGSYLGALYGSSSNNKFAAFLRHANFSSKVNGLYFLGGSVHPGGGIPLCMLSAKIVDDLIPRS
jgi:diapolycopene oxygenase